MFIMNSRAVPADKTILNTPGRHKPKRCGKWVRVRGRLGRWDFRREGTRAGLHVKPYRAPASRAALRWRGECVLAEAAQVGY